MARLSVLDRFRPVGAPGPAGPAGVPATDEQGRAAELAPVFAALADDVAACAALVEDARLQAENDVAAASSQAAAIVSQARLDAGAARANAASRVGRDASEANALVTAQAHREAEELEASGLARIPAIVDKAINTLLNSRMAEHK